MRQEKVIDRYLLDREKGNLGIDIEPGVWHCSVSLEPGTIIFEVKRGPFEPMTHECLAPWASAADDKEAADLYIQQLLKENSIKF